MPGHGVSEKGGGEETWLGRLALGTQGFVLQNAACSGLFALLVGSETGSGMGFVMPPEAPLPSKRQPLLLQEQMPFSRCAA